MLWISTIIACVECIILVPLLLFSMFNVIYILLTLNINVYPRIMFFVKIWVFIVSNEHTVLICNCWYTYYSIEYYNCNYITLINSLFLFSTTMVVSLYDAGGKGPVKNLEYTARFPELCCSLNSNSLWIGVVPWLRLFSSSAINDVML